jgi:predicted dehydrogenase
VHRIAVGLIGCGHWGEKLARNFAAAPEFHLAAVCDVDGARAADVARRHGADRTWDDAERLLGAGVLQAVALATPAATHAALVRRALAAGVHVLCEKPLALSAAEGAELLGLATQAGRALVTDHTELHSGAFRTLSARLAAGDIGAVRGVSLLHANVAAGPADLDVVWDLAPHDFAILDALGLGEPAACDATTAGPAGRTVRLDIRWASGVRTDVVLERGAAVRRRSLEVRGTHGTLRTVGFRPGDEVRLRGEGSDGLPEAVFASDAVEPLRRLVDVFAERVGNGQATAGHAAEARILRSVELAARSFRSAAVRDRAAASPD